MASVDSASSSLSFSGEVLDRESIFSFCEASFCKFKKILIFNMNTWLYEKIYTQKWKREAVDELNVNKHIETFSTCKNSWKCAGTYTTKIASPLS